MYSTQKRTVALALTAAAVAVALGFTPAAHSYAPTLLVFNDASSVEDLQQQLLDIRDRMSGIEAHARSENRELTAEEETQANDLFAQFESIEARIQMAERRTSRAPGRQAEPNGMRVAEPTNPNASRAQLDQRQGMRASVPARPHSADNGMGGFNGMGEYLMSVMTASAKGGVTDPRLVMNAPSTYGQEAVGTDGGFAVPPDFRSTIVSKVMGDDSLLKLTDQWTTSSNAITVPVDETTPWQTTGGIQAYWESEGGQKQQSKPQLAERTVKANKIIALVPLTDELLEDAPSMASYVNKKAPEKIDFKVTDAIINGTGVGQPLGILTSAGTIVVPAESGQAADTVIYANIANIWNRMFVETLSLAGISCAGRPQVRLRSIWARIT